jgi:hypothetical protein
MICSSLPFRGEVYGQEPKVNASGRKEICEVTVNELSAIVRLDAFDRAAELCLDVVAEVGNVGVNLGLVN